MPYASHVDRNAWMKKYREKNRKKISEQRAESKAWKRATEEDERRRKASAALDILLAGHDQSQVSWMYSVLSQCTPAMIEDLLARSGRLT